MAWWGEAPQEADERLARVFRIGRAERALQAGEGARRVDGEGARSGVGAEGAAPAR